MESALIGIVIGLSLGWKPIIFGSCPMKFVGKTLLPVIRAAILGLQMRFKGSKIGTAGTFISPSPSTQFHWYWLMILALQVSVTACCVIGHCVGLLLLVGERWVEMGRGSRIMRASETREKSRKCETVGDFSFALVYKKYWIYVCVRVFFYAGAHCSNS